MKRWFALLLTLLPLIGTGLLHAGEAVPLAEDPVVEKRLIAISEEMRCLVCQNESLAGSRADLAEDLRREIRSLIRQGKTDAEVMDFLVTRYGDFVRYRPPFKPLTWMLWVGPFVLLAGAFFLLLRRIRRSSPGGTAEGAAPDAAEEAARRERARALLNETQERS